MQLSCVITAFTVFFPELEKIAQTGFARSPRPLSCSEAGSAPTNPLLTDFSVSLTETFLHLPWLGQQLINSKKKENKLFFIRTQLSKTLCSPHQLELDNFRLMLRKRNEKVPGTVSTHL